MNWSEVRTQFPALNNWTWLNTATYGQVPLRSQAAVAAHFARRDEFACADFLKWFDDADEIRVLCARLVNCQPDDIAFCDNSCAALSLFLGGIEWQPGDRVLTMPDEFPNQYYYASMLGAKGVELIETAQLDPLPERTRAVILSSVSYTTGHRPDLARISGLAHDAGALVYVDGTQSVGALRFDAAEIKPDLLAVNSYKWLLGPNGASFFYVSPELRGRLEPSVIGWRSDRNWRSVHALHHGAPHFADSAQRYEGGMLNFPSLYAMGESIRMNLEIGPEIIEHRVLDLAARVSGILQSAGAAILHENTNIVAAHWPGRDASALAKQLEAQRIIVAARHGNLRVSPHFYNNESDLETLAAAVKGYLPSRLSAS